MSVYYYVISFDPYPSTSDDYIADSLKALFPEHWNFADNTWVMRSSKPEAEVRHELNNLLIFGRILWVAISEKDRGRWYSHDDTAPSWLRSKESTSDE